jgi:nucleotide-binding universal stress UspA family protein
MGAYGHSHERETLFGGNTQSVVDEAEFRSCWFTEI